MKRRIILGLVIIMLSSTGCVQATVYKGKISVDFSTYNSSVYSANFNLYKAGE